MYGYCYRAVAWSDDRGDYPTALRTTPFALVRRPTTARVNMPAPRPEGTELRRW